MKIKLQSIAKRKSENAGSEEFFAGEISVTEGLHGDKSCRTAPGEIALLSKESWVKVCHETEKELSWLVHGSNLLIKGFEFLPGDLGKLIRIGEAELEIVRELSPAPNLKKQEPELFDILHHGWRGGVVCKVLCGGEIQCGDDVDISG